MAVQVFETAAEAQEVARTFVGWEWEIIPYNLEGPDGWAIQVRVPGSTGQPMYLHEDGDVR